MVVNDSMEIFISDNRAHCVKVFDYQGNYLRQIGGEGVSNFPIGVGLTASGEICIADNHNNFNLTVFSQAGQLLGALESKAGVDIFRTRAESSLRSGDFHYYNISRTIWMIKSLKIVTYVFWLLTCCYMS